MESKFDYYFIIYSQYKELVSYIEESLCVWVSVCLDTNTVLLLDKSTRLSVGQVGMSGNPLKDLKDAAIEWCEKIVLFCIEKGWVQPIRE